MVDKDEMIQARWDLKAAKGVGKRERPLVLLVVD